MILNSFSRLKLLLSDSLTVEEDTLRLPALNQNRS